MTMTAWQRREDWVGSQVDDRYVMINLESGEYVALNETATEVWMLLEEPRDADTLVDRLTASFAVDRDACRRSLDALLADMQAKQLAEPVPV
jgi:hypothetical protein